MLSLLYSGKDQTRIGTKITAKGAIPHNKAAKSAMGDYVASLGADFTAGLPGPATPAPKTKAKGKSKGEKPKKEA